MSKIVRAVNTMITNQEKISDIIRKGQAYYFLYDVKYKWSISFSKGDDVYNLILYPGKYSLEHLASMSIIERVGFDEMMVYSTQDLGTKEAYNTFKDLYMILQERGFGVDKVLDDIIKSDIEF